MMDADQDPPTPDGGNVLEENTTINMDVSIPKEYGNGDDARAVEDTPFEEKKDGTVDDNDDGNDSTEMHGLQHQQHQDELEAEQVAAAMTLEVAYQSLEMIRQLNLQVEFGKDVVDDSLCVTCLRAEHKNPPPPIQPPPQSPSIASGKFAATRLGKWMASSSSTSSSLLSSTINKRKVATAAAGTACFTCGSPVCKKHRSSDFGKQNIIICSDCAHLFSMNYMIHHVVDVTENSSSKVDLERQQQQHPNVEEQERQMETKKKINRMLEVYDRSLLVLRYSIQYIDEVALALQTNTSRHNKIGLGSSATGMVAGGLGVAAACTIWTPVGPPLLVASILFGGGATAVNAGSEAVNYRCEPNKMADRILTLHSIVSSIAQLPGAMDHRMMLMMEERERQNLRQEAGTDGQVDGDIPTGDDGYILSNQDRDEDQARLHWTRTAMNGLKPLTMGALSAVSIVTEAREMKRAVDKIRAGNPCDKAERLLAIKNEMEHIPHTEDLSHQLNLILSRQRV